MKKLLLMGLIVCVVQAMAQETPIQKQVNAVSQNLFSKQKLFKPKEISFESTSLKNYITKYDLMEADNNVLNKIINDKTPALEIDINVNRSLLTLRLLRNDKLTDGENLVKTNDGQVLPGIATAYYYGVIKDQPNSFVVITFFRNSIMGTISNKTGNYTLSKKSGLDMKGNDYFIFNEKDLQIKKNFRCGNNEMPIQIPNIPSTNSVFGTPYKCLTIYLEVDYPLFQKLGSIANCNAYVNQMKAVLYTTFLNESITISFSTTVIDSGGDTYGTSTLITVLAANFNTSVGIPSRGILLICYQDAQALIIVDMDPGKYVVHLTGNLFQLA